MQYSDEFRKEMVRRMLNGETPTDLHEETDIPRQTLSHWKNKELKTAQSLKPKDIGRDPILCFVDIETLPNRGYFFDVYSDRSIPLDFIEKAKCICTLAYKFSDEDEATALMSTTPYDDKDVLEAFLKVIERADYVVWHFGEGFDRPFIEGRLLVNGLHSLPVFTSIDTYKLAKAKFGKSLNSNRLDHLGTLLGVGRKNKTDASLWVKCAQGDEKALQEMAEYNVQDIVLLEAVYYKLAPNIKSKVNHNLFHSDKVNRCKSCGNDNLELKGMEYKQSTFHHRYQCKSCKSWSTFPCRKH